MWNVRFAGLQQAVCFNVSLGMNVFMQTDESFTYKRKNRRSKSPQAIVKLGM